MGKGWNAISVLAIVCFGYACHAQKNNPWMKTHTTLKPQSQTRPQPVEQTPGKIEPWHPWVNRPTTLKPQPQTRPQPAQPTPGKFEPGHPVTESEPFQRCRVDDFERVQCGEPGIGAADCDAINCCFDGPQCYYGKAVTLQCTRDGQFVVVVARDATLPQLSLDSVSLLGGNDAPCSPVGTTAAFAIFQFPVTACGTFMTEEGGYVVYENRMSSSYEVGIGPLGSITRDSHYELLFQCRYSGTSVEALLVEVNTVPPPSPVAAPGPLRVELRLANGQCFSKGCVEGDEAYTSYYSEADYPVTKVLQQPVYAEVHILGRTDPNIVLTLGRCWATSSPDPVSVPQWDLLIDGCPYQDDRYLTTLFPVDGSSGLPYPSHYKRFALKMFTFVDPESFVPLKQRVFIHCSTAVCHLTATDTCEQRCSSQGSTKCIRERTKSEESRLLGRFTPQCDEEGHYLPMQCRGSTGYCWCVDKNGKEIANTRLPPGHGRPQCGGGRDVPKTKSNTQHSTLVSGGEVIMYPD